MKGHVFAEETVINAGPLYQGKYWLAPGLFKTLNVKASDLEEARGE